MRSEFALSGRGEGTYRFGVAFNEGTIHDGVLLRILDVSLLVALRLEHGTVAKFFSEGRSTSVFLDHAAEKL